VASSDGLVKRNWGEATPGAQALVPGTATERELRLGLRIQELLKWTQRGGTYCIDERDWVYPKLAVLIVQEWTEYHLGTGPYTFMNRKDRDNRFMRIMENIADKSNGIPGLPAWNHK
jgi:hypothetical protein